MQSVQLQQRQYWLLILEKICTHHDQSLTCIQFVPAPLVMSQREWPSSLLDWQHRQKKKEKENRTVKWITVVGWEPGICWLRWASTPQNASRQIMKYNLLKVEKSMECFLGFFSGEAKGWTSLWCRKFSFSATSCGILCCVFWRVILFEETNTWYRQAL